MDCSRHFFRGRRRASDSDNDGARNVDELSAFATMEVRASAARRDRK